MEILSVTGGGDGADKNFRPIYTIMLNMNEIHERVFKIWGLININAKTLTLCPRMWQKDEWMNGKAKTIYPTYFVCMGYKNWFTKVQDSYYKQTKPDSIMTRQYYTGHCLSYP